MLSIYDVTDCTDKLQLGSSLEETKRTDVISMSDATVVRDRVILRVVLKSGNYGVIVY